MNTVLRSFLLTFAFFCTVEFALSQDSSHVQTSEPMKSINDSLYHKFDSLYEKNLALVEKAESNMDIASKIIDWSAMLFAALAILLIVAGTIGLKEFSNFKRVEAQMKEELQRVRGEIDQIREVRIEVQNELNMLKEKIQKDGQNIFKTIYLLNEGISSFNSGNLQNAIRVFKDVKKINPNDYDATCLLARAYSGQEEFSKAIETAKEAVKFSSSPRQAHYIMGECYRRMEKFEEAIDAFNQSLKIEERTPTLNSLGYCYFKKHDFPLAEETFKRSLKVMRNATGEIGLAKSLLKQGDYKKACLYCNSSIVLAKEDIEIGVPYVWPYYNLASAYLILNNETECLQNIEAAILKNKNKGQIREQVSDYILMLNNEHIDQELLKKCINKWENAIKSYSVST